MLIYLTELKSIAKRHTIFNVAREEVKEGSFLGLRQGLVIGFGKFGRGEWRGGYIPGSHPLKFVFKFNF